MRMFLVLAAALAVSLSLSGCASCDPDESVSLQIYADEDLNTYTEGGREGSHSLDLYVFKVDDPDAFLGSSTSSLRVIEADVTGGWSLGRWEISPGETNFRAELDKMRDEKWTHIGIFAAFGNPDGAPDAQKQVVKIDSDCGMKLCLGARRILSFTGD